VLLIVLLCFIGTFGFIIKYCKINSIYFKLHIATAHASTQAVVGLLQSINRKNKTNILVSYTVEMDLFACYMKHRIMIAIMELCNTVYYRADM